MYTPKIIQYVYDLFTQVSYVLSVYNQIIRLACDSKQESIEP